MSDKPYTNWERWVFWLDRTTPGRATMAALRFCCFVGGGLLVLATVWMFERLWWAAA